MPRIKAASVAEHVAEQEAAVFAAAIELFVERGYENVTLGDIAAKIGLARNSLYRYFPDKAHILLRWLHQELPRQSERSAQLLGGSGDPHDRIEAWALDQLTYAAGPEHELMARVRTILPELDPETRAELASSHDMLVRPLLDTLAEAGIGSRAERQVVADLIQQLVVAAARPGAGAREAVLRRRYLLRGIDGLLTS